MCVSASSSIWPKETAGAGAFRQEISLQAALADASCAYAAGRYTQALEHYRYAAALPNGQHNSRALAGAYVSLLRLGRLDEATALFAQLLQSGFLKADTLSFKILFAVIGELLRRRFPHRALQRLDQADR
ncbi:MAG: tetratricopeptide repeat protein [Thiolinea sp.]